MDLIACSHTGCSVHTDSGLFTVPELCLCIGANYLQVPRGREEGVQLIRRGLVQQRWQKHPEVQVQRPGASILYGSGVASERVMGAKQ